MYITNFVLNSVKIVLFLFIKKIQNSQHVHKEIAIVMMLLTIWENICLILINNKASVFINVKINGGICISKIDQKYVYKKKIQIAII